jgi:peptide/nickel transport system ATP-binding protein
VPVPDPSLQRTGRIILKGDVPSPIDPPPGCRFHPRCHYAESVCAEREPELSEIHDQHWAACHFAGHVGLQS